MNKRNAARKHHAAAGGAMPTAGADSSDRAFRSVGDTAHKAASWNDRDTAAWRPRRGSADADLLPELDTMRGRARDIDRNNGVAKGMVQTVVDNVVGTGLRLAARPNYKALGQTKEWADAWRADVQGQWEAYWWTTACHSGDTMTGDQLTAQALRSQLVNGDACGLLDWLPGRDDYATKIKTIESDRLSNPQGEMDSPILRGGIALDLSTGAPQGYWFRNAHPGDSYLAGMNQFPAWEFVSRRTSSGRLRVLHAFDPERSEQHRGKPIMASILPLFKQLDRYMNAEVAAAVINAMIAGIITTPMAMEDIVELFKNDADKYLQMRRDHAVGLESGSLIPLAPGDSITPFMPQRPAAGYAAFVENILRIIGTALDLPYELVLKDFSKTNYSSARAALLEAWRSFMRRRDWLGTQWCDPIYGAWMEERVNAGKIKAPDFYSNRAAYQRCKWVGPGRGAIDPLKEAMGDQVSVDAGFSTLEEVCAARGGDWEEYMEQRATELKRAQELGLPQIVSGRATIVPDDTSNAAGEVTPGAAPKDSASAYTATLDYRMEVPGQKSELATIKEMLVRIEARLPVPA